MDAALAIKRAYPILRVAVFDAQEGQSELIALTNLITQSSPFRWRSAVRKAIWRALKRHGEDRLTGRWPPIGVTSQNLIGNPASLL